MMNTDAYKQELVAEKERLETNLAAIGRKTGIPEDWEAVPEDMNVPRADVNETADEMEEYETRIATTAALEDRLKDITDSLGRIDAGTYGTCSVCGNPIEEDRLAANPAAATCKAHL